jgi:hypothetical protein
MTLTEFSDSLLVTIATVMIATIMMMTLEEATVALVGWG